LYPRNSCVGDIDVRRMFELTALLLVQCPHHPGRTAQCQRTIGEFLAFGHQSPRPDNAMRADPGAVEQRRSHADQTVVTHDGRMDDGTVTDRHAVAEHHRQPRIGVDHAIILHVRSFTDGDPVVVAAQHGAEPHARILEQPHPADQHRIRRDIVFAFGRQLGSDPINRIKRHFVCFPYRLSRC